MDTLCRRTHLQLSLFATSAHCNAEIEILQKWPQDGRNLKNRQAFSIFATQMLEQRALQAYQKAEARKESLRRFHSTLDPRAPRFLIQSLTVEITVFEPGDIEIDYTVPANTGGAFCDLLCGRHLKLGKVALKRLRSDMSGSSRLPVRSMAHLYRLII